MALRSNETNELLKRVRRIELRTKGLSSQLFSGEYHSAFKGRGMAFSEVREYAPGDEIRTIDWNVTARTGIAHVKVFEEERELTVMLLVDVSASDDFGATMMTKRSLITELSAVLSFSAIQNNDKVGVIFFSDRIENFIPPKKGRSHILMIISTLLEFKPEGKRTDISLALGYLNQVVKKRSTAFLLSDFMDDGFENALKIANKKHDIIALQVNDRKEKVLPDAGIVRFSDRESGMTQWVDTSNKKVRTKYAAEALRHNAELQEIFRRSGVDNQRLLTDEPYIVPLMQLFKRR